MNKKIFKTNIGEAELSFEFGKLAQKSDVSIFARLGDTCVLTTVCVGGESNLGYFPLSVEYVEKLYAGGRIKGSRWVKRDGKPTDEAILKGRFIDRSIRPLFDKNYTKDVQIVNTLLSYDNEHSPEILAAISTSAALHVSQIPWNGPISTMRVGYVENDGESVFVINPAEDVQDYSDLDLIVSSTEKKVLMIETQSSQLSEDTIKEGIAHAHEINVALVKFIDSIRKDIGKEKESVEPNVQLEDLKKTLSLEYSKQLGVLTEKNAFQDDEYDDLKSEFINEVAEKHEITDKRLISDALEYHILQKIRDDVMDNGKRFDGRKMDEIRELTAEIDILPRTHGSAIFQRGMTQVLSIATLGSSSLEQLIESTEGEESKRYIHHYSSPPYSYGQTGRMGWPGRREIGHGALAEKALEPVLPTKEEFPYTIQVVSEVMSSNGSTSMASTCGSSLALMNAGVPIKKAVGGISIGLMYRSDDDYTLLTDIAGIEDFAGYMDFKVAGTDTGITAIQLDVKNDGLTLKMIDEILERAKTARAHVLDVMNSAISKPQEMSEYAPKVVMLTPPADKIGEIIGPGGKNIKRIIAESGASVDVSDDGKVSISGTDSASVEKAVEAVKAVYRSVEIGEEFEGPVTRILPIGAMVEYLPGKEGLVHISNLSDEYVKNVSDVVKEGQMLKVKVLKVDERGRINLGVAK